MCDRGAEQNKCGFAVKTARDRADTVLLEYVHPLVNVGSFKYLGKLLSSNDYDFPIVVDNIMYDSVAHSGMGER